MKGRTFVSKALARIVESTIYGTENLDEKMMVFGKSAYPKFNTVVIMAGGAGSGKGFVIDYLVGVEGKTLDVDALKKAVLKLPRFDRMLKQEFGVTDVNDINLREPSNVSKLHVIVDKELDIPDKKESTLFKSILTAHPERKPNLIFDVTMKDFKKMEDIASAVQSLGYNKRDIHLVWVLNKLEVAMAQNKGRDRIVPEDIFLKTHEGASLTMHKIITMGDQIKKYCDGDMYIAFNQAGVDSRKLDARVTDGKKRNNGGILYHANYLKIKKQGGSMLGDKVVTKDVVDIIQDYVPNGEVWK